MNEAEKIKDKINQINAKYLSRGANEALSHPIGIILIDFKQNEQSEVIESIDPIEFDKESFLAELDNANIIDEDGNNAIEELRVFVESL